MKLLYALRIMLSYSKQSIIALRYVYDNRSMRKQKDTKKRWEGSSDRRKS